MHAPSEDWIHIQPTRACTLTRNHLTTHRCTWRRPNQLSPTGQGETFFFFLVIILLSVHSILQFFNEIWLLLPHYILRGRQTVFLNIFASKETIREVNWCLKIAKLWKLLYWELSEYIYWYMEYTQGSYITSHMTLSTLLFFWVPDLLFCSYIWVLISSLF